MPKSYAGGEMGDWQLIDAGHNPITDDVIAGWDTRDLVPCTYALRLLARDHSIIDCDDPQESEYLLTVEVGDCDPAYDFDVDDDGDVDLEDYSEFGVCYTGPR